MLSRLIGTIQAIEPQAVELFAHPFTFYVITPKTHGFKLNDTHAFYTYMQVKEDGVTLFGFIHEQDKALFLQLLKVRSIGPKLALQIMQSDMQQFVTACQRQDKMLLCSIPGIGAKTAARILAEIDVNTLPVMHDHHHFYAQAKQLLLTLGFNESKIDEVLVKCPQDSLDNLVKTALKNLGERCAKSSVNT